ncbi:hypothetical protein ACWDBD_07005 [Streptomyces sp. NPDC001118]|uniref:hypothetical protein n=1 Tax=Streptomyces sp. NPDC001127 TaxID=3154377 RepID=UPI00332EB125
MSPVDELVLDTPTLVALGGNKQVSGLVHTAATTGDLRLWVPMLCLLEAERERSGITEHVGLLLDALHLVDDDYALTLTVAELGRRGVPHGMAAAVHMSRPNPAVPLGALVATVEPDAYGGLGVPVFDLNR